MARIRIGCVAYPVADHVEGQDRDDHEKPGQRSMSAGYQGGER